MSARARLLLDLGMFVGLLAAFNPAWTGMALHEWLSVALIVPLLLHLIINWEWTVRVLNTFAERLFHASRLNLLVDVALFVSAVAVMLSGLVVSSVISGVFGVANGASALWVAVHSVSADAAVALLLLHLGLHWRWILNVSRKFAAGPQSRSLGRVLRAQVATSASAQPVPQQASMAPAYVQNRPTRR
jgi:Na+/H+-dicarboxylate symporter